MNSPFLNGQETVERSTRGRFARGNKASPGRPPGRGVVAELRDKLATDIDEIIARVRTQALGGDMQAIRIILDRVMPTLRPVELPAVLALPAEGTLTQQARAVVQGLADGDLAPAQAAQIVAALGGVAKLVETVELELRIAALEAQQRGNA